MRVWRIRLLLGVLALICLFNASEPRQALADQAGTRQNCALPVSIRGELSVSSEKRNLLLRMNKGLLRDVFGNRLYTLYFDYLQLLQKTQGRRSITQLNEIASKTIYGHAILSAGLKGHEFTSLSVEDRDRVLVQLGVDTASESALRAHQSQPWYEDEREFENGPFDSRELFPSDQPLLDAWLDQAKRRSRPL